MVHLYTGMLFFSVLTCSLLLAAMSLKISFKFAGTQGSGICQQSDIFERGLIICFLSKEFEATQLAKMHHFTHLLKTKYEIKLILCLV
jgi:hypothetical protein